MSIKKLVCAILLIGLSKVLMAKQPNFLFIAIDDLNDHLGCMAEEAGNDLQLIYPDPGMRAKIRERITPHLDRLAASGVPFMRSYTACTVCNPSRTALMTGVRPHRSGILDNKKIFRQVPGMEDRVTLSQHLKNNGYYTAGIGKIYHMPISRPGKDIPDAKYSWNTWINHGVGASGDFVEEDEPRLKWLGRLKQGLKECADWQNADFIGEVLEKGRATLKGKQSIALPQDKPFFLACGIFRPHIPWYVPSDYYDRFPIAEMGVTSATIDGMLADMEDVPDEGRRHSALHHGVLKGVFEQAHKVKLAGGELRAYQRLIQGYLASVNFADECVGRLLDALDNSPYRDNTIVVLWSDHGWHTATKYTFDKLTLWEGSARVVTMIRDPRNGVVNQPCYRTVSLMDLYPTIASLAGLDRPADIDGRDLSPLILDPTQPWEDCVITSYGDGHHTVRTADWRFIRYREGDTELYHMAQDPWEYINLAENVYFSLRKYDLERELNEELGKNKMLH